MTSLFVTILETLSSITRWHRMCNWYRYVKVNVFYTTMTQIKNSKYSLILWQENFTHQSCINKQNNYHNAYPSLLIGCHCRCTKTILRCKSVVCANQLGAKLNWFKNDFMCWKHELQTDIFDSKYRKIRMFQFGLMSYF